MTGQHHSYRSVPDVSRQGHSIPYSKAKPSSLHCQIFHALSESPHRITTKLRCSIYSHDGCLVLTSALLHASRYSHVASSGSVLNNAVASCPSDIQCSGHGVCDTTAFRCTCAAGWQAADCSERTCPSGLSWFSYPTADNVGHNVETECGDMGLCDRNTGKCICRTGFYGQACEYMHCPKGVAGECNGHGRCMSMYELAQAATVNGDTAGFTYGTDPNNPATWDAHRIFGCLCDVGYEGYDCTLLSCPLGNDAGVYDAVNEVQLVQCIASGGTFTISFRQYTTVPLAFNATAAQVQQALSSLPSIDGPVYVNYFNLTHNSFCGRHRHNSAISIEFPVTYGNLPALKFDTSLLENGYTGSGVAGTGVITIATDGAVMGKYVSVAGTTASQVCSNRGVCDRTTGLCKCVSGWGSSNGMGGLGERGDCGYRLSLE